MKKQFSVTKNAKYFVAGSIIVILASLIAYIVMGFTLGIDFSGGSIWTVDMGQTFTDADVPAMQAIAKTFIPGETSVSVSGDTAAVFRYQANSDDADKDMEIRTSMLAEIQKTYPSASGNERQLVGPTAGAEMRNNALMSVTIACALMLVYIWFRFELVFGVAAIIALLHDVLIMAGVMVFTRTQVNSSFIAAMLTIVGYSINDTIVLFDRIRENVKLMKGKPRREIVDTSFLETLARTINTSLTVFITLLVLYILGVQSIKEFALPLIVGVVSGTYSSILIASPIWIWIHEATDRRRKAKLEAKRQQGKGGKTAKSTKPAKSKV